MKLKEWQVRYGLWVYCGFSLDKATEMAKRIFTYFAKEDKNG